MFPADPMTHTDLLVIGAGINGTGIARDAAGRGLSVTLVDAGDIGGATSSASTKLIHGGLRYLEHYAFKLVAEALAEREVIWRIAPHLVRPMRFVVPMAAGHRPAWMIRLGLTLYDRLATRGRLPAHEAVDLTQDEAGEPLQTGLRRGFEYSDLWVDDSRLTLINALDAAERGATVCPRTEFISAERRTDDWLVTLEHAGQRRQLTARALVNATGAHVAALYDRLGLAAPASIRLVRGSHIAVPALFKHDRAYLFQNPDGRVVFAIPWEGLTVIGTTDAEQTLDEPVEASAEEVAYLCEAASAWFARAITPADVVHSWAGLRALAAEPGGSAQEASREYRLELHGGGREGGPPLLSVFGGKLTTYRTLSQAALSKLAPHLPMGGEWTADAPLPGGDFDGDVTELAAMFQAEHPWLDDHTALRIARAYGTRARRWLTNAPGRDFGHGLTEAEVRWLIDHEWATTDQDVLWRRTKLGLRLSADQVAALTDWMAART